MGVSICRLEPEGVIEPHIHSFEESIYILMGEVVADIGEKAYRLHPGHFGLIGTGVRHAWRNATDQPVRWLEMQAPQPRPAEYARDTFFPGGDVATTAAAPDPSDPAQRFLGYFDESQLPHPGGPSQMEGFNPTTGIAIRMFVDRSIGAIHQSLFLIQYWPGAKIDPHDHTFEEFYLIVSGQVRATADGHTYDMGPGDVIWTSVGCIHSFANLGREPSAGSRRKRRCRHQRKCFDSSEIGSIWPDNTQHLRVNVPRTQCVWFFESVRLFQRRQVERRIERNRFECIGGHP